MKILITGGCGYVGSHTIIELLEDGHEIVVIDNLSNSNKEALKRVEKTSKIAVPYYKVVYAELAALR